MGPLVSERGTNPGANPELSGVSQRGPRRQERGRWARRAPRTPRPAREGGSGHPWRRPLLQPTGERGRASRRSPAAPEAVLCAAAAGSQVVPRRGRPPARLRPGPARTWGRAPLSPPRAAAARVPAPRALCPRADSGRAGPGPWEPALGRPAARAPERRVPWRRFCARLASESGAGARRAPSTVSPGPREPPRWRWRKCTPAPGERAFPSPPLPRDSRFPVPSWLGRAEP